MENDKRNRNWVFTLNNYTEDDCAAVKVLAGSRCKYAVVGKEVGEMGTPHLQGALWLKNAMTRSALSSALPRAHLEAMVSDASATYCAKDGDLLVNNPPPCSIKPGARTDIARALALLDEGKRLDEIGRTVHNYQALRHAELVQKYTPCPRLHLPDKKVYWVYGPTGTGKTTFAYSLGPHYTKLPGNWWQDYAGEDVVVFDEFRPDFAPWSKLLFWFDNRSFPAETKGSYVHVTATKMVVTCPMHPEEMFADVKEDINQLLRRLTIIRSEDLPRIE